MGLQLTRRRQAEFDRQHATAAPVRGHSAAASPRSIIGNRIAAYNRAGGENSSHRFETLCAERGEEKVRASWSAAEKSIAGKSSDHARAIRAERNKAAQKAASRISSSCCILGRGDHRYRKRLIDSPSYTLNHEEVEKKRSRRYPFAENSRPLPSKWTNSLRQGLTVTSKRTLADGSTETATDASGAARYMTLQAPRRTRAGARGRAQLPSRRPLLPGLRRERPAGENPKKRQAASRTCCCRSAPTDTIRQLLRDLHPSFFAMWSRHGRRQAGLPVVSAFWRRLLSFSEPMAISSRRSTAELRATVHEVIRLTPTSSKCDARAAGCEEIPAGQFYRLQNFETLAHHVDGTPWRWKVWRSPALGDRDKGLVSTIVLEMGGSSDLCALLKPGEPVILMGPPARPPKFIGKSWCWSAAASAMPWLFSIGRVARSRSKVLYFAGYKKMIDRYKIMDIEKRPPTSCVVLRRGAGIEPNRPTIRAFVGKSCRRWPRTHKQSRPSGNPLQSGRSALSPSAPTG